jgi:hypothetical protein
MCDISREAQARSPPSPAADGARRAPSRWPLPLSSPPAAAQAALFALDHRSASNLSSGHASFFNLRRPAADNNCTSRHAFHVAGATAQCLRQSAANPRLQRFLIHRQGSLRLSCLLLSFRSPATHCAARLIADSA